MGKTWFYTICSDIFQQHLYCIHWIRKSSLGKSRQDTLFAAPNTDDMAREKRVKILWLIHVAEWQDKSIVPDMAIERGKHTTRPIWERGWTHWHHLFSLRQIPLIAAYLKRSSSPESAIFNAKSWNWNAKIFHWTAALNKTNNVFYNQAVNTLYNYACRCFLPHEAGLSFGFKTVGILKVEYKIEYQPAEKVSHNNNIYITDPPYADAVNYHEITEVFILWLRKNPPSPFDTWE